MNVHVMHSCNRSNEAYNSVNYNAHYLAVIFIFIQYPTETNMQNNII